MSDLNTIVIAILIMIPITLLTKKLLKNFDNIENQSHENIDMKNNND